MASIAWALTVAFVALVGLVAWVLWLRHGRTYRELLEAQAERWHTQLGNVMKGRDELIAVERRRVDAIEARVGLTKDFVEKQADHDKRLYSLEEYAYGRKR